MRNAVIGNYNPLRNRTDTGPLWENFILAERMKFLDNSSELPSRYFWRTTQQQEIDYIEETPEGLRAFELKWNPNRNVRFSKTFLNAYTIAETAVITPIILNHLLEYFDLQWLLELPDIIRFFLFADSRSRAVARINNRLFRKSEHSLVNCFLQRFHIAAGKIRSSEASFEKNVAAD